MKTTVAMEHVFHSPLLLINVALCQTVQTPLKVYVVTRHVILEHVAHLQNVVISYAWTITVLSAYPKTNVPSNTYATMDNAYSLSNVSRTMIVEMEMHVH